MKKWIAVCMAVLLLALPLLGCRPVEKETVYILCGVVEEKQGTGITEEVDIRYDALGNLTQYDRALSGGEPERMAERTYDEQGNCLSYWRTSWHGLEEIRETYDKRGNVLSEIVEGCLREYTYDNENRRITTTVYDENGNVTIRSRSSYDPQGNLLRQTTQRDGTVYELVNVYDDRGNQLSQTSYVDGKLNPNEQCYTWTYDENGNLLEERLYRGEEPTHEHREVYTYDENNRKQTLTTYYMGTLTSRSLFTRDEAGNVICYEKETFSSDGGKETTVDHYAYDEQGNVIRQETVKIKADGTKTTSLKEYAYDQWGNKILERYSSNGRLYRTDGWEYNAAGDWVALYTNGVCTDRKTFDENGNMLIYTLRRDKGTREYVCTYDANGNILSEIKTDWNGQRVTTWTYDEKGNMLTYHRVGGNDFDATYTYDEQGNLIEYTCTNSYGTFTTRYTYQAVEVTKEQAEQVKAQQKEIWRYLDGDVMILF